MSVADLTPGRFCFVRDFSFHDESTVLSSARGGEPFYSPSSPLDHMEQLDAFEEKFWSALREASEADRLSFPEPVKNYLLD